MKQLVYFTLIAKLKAKQLAFMVLLFLATACQNTQPVTVETSPPPIDEVQLAWANSPEADHTRDTIRNTGKWMYEMMPINRQDKRAILRLEREYLSYIKTMKGVLNQAEQQAILEQKQSVPPDVTYKDVAALENDYRTRMARYNAQREYFESVCFGKPSYSIAPLCDEVHTITQRFERQLSGLTAMFIVMDERYNQAKALVW